MQFTSALEGPLKDIHVALHFTFLTNYSTSKWETSVQIKAGANLGFEGRVQQCWKLEKWWRGGGGACQVVRFHIWSPFVFAFSLILFLNNRMCVHWDRTPPSFTIRQWELECASSWDNLLQLGVNSSKIHNQKILGIIVSQNVDSSHQKLLQTWMSN